MSLNFVDDERSEAPTPSRLTRLQSKADYEVENCYTATTNDNEDHSFCGVMFNVTLQSVYPIQYIEIYSFSARGALGPISVWVTKEGGFEDKHETSEEWNTLYQGHHSASFYDLQDFVLDEPIRLYANGESRGIYIHSARPGDQGIVYDNQKMFTSSHCNYEDDFVGVSHALAHLSNRPFGRRGPWGHPWRNRREFVGKIRYGVKYMLWSPKLHVKMPIMHQHVVWTLLLCSRRPDCPLSSIPHDVLLYILNMLAPWDFKFGDEKKMACLKAGGDGGGSTIKYYISKAFSAVGGERLTNWWKKK